MAKIHPTAIVDPSAKLGEDVEIGPFCIVESDVEIGDRCVLRSNAIVRRYTTMGKGNTVDSFCVLGGQPQDFKFDPSTPTYLSIGDENTFREGVTISRATGENCETRIGNRGYWMANSHAGHNATVGDNVILVNGASLAGHSIVEDRVIFSAHSAVHQFCRVGEMVMLQGNAGTSMHVPPYVILAMPMNNVVGLNSVGLRRAEHISDEDQKQIKAAFKLLYRSGLTPKAALQEMEKCDWGEPADKFRQFVKYALTAEKPHNRGLCPMFNRKR